MTSDHLLTALATAHRHDLRYDTTTHSPRLAADIPARRRPGVTRARLRLPRHAAAVRPRPTS